MSGGLAKGSGNLSLQNTIPAWPCHEVRSRKNDPVLDVQVPYQARDSLPVLGFKRIIVHVMLNHQERQPVARLSASRPIVAIALLFLVVSFLSSTASRAEAGCGDYLYQHGRFSGDRGLMDLHGDHQGNGVRGGDAAARHPLGGIPPQCTGPGCSQQGLPVPSPIELRFTSSRETLLLSLLVQPTLPSSLLVPPDLLVVAKRHALDILRPPR
jgi:hypothetical protein